MGFRNGAFATVWEVKPKTPNVTSVRVSVSKKNRDTGEYEQSFSGFVSFIGKETASAAAGLHEKQRIKLGECDVTTSYDSQKKITYTNYACFSFEIPDGNGSQHTSAAQAAQEGENPFDGDADLTGKDLPF